MELALWQDLEREQSIEVRCLHRFPGHLFREQRAEAALQQRLSILEAEILECTESEPMPQVNQATGQAKNALIRNIMFVSLNPTCLTHPQAVFLVFGLQIVAQPRQSLRSAEVDTGLDGEVGYLYVSPYHYQRP